jgi:HSP20 family protein
MLLTTFDALGEFDRITRRAFAPVQAGVARSAAGIRMDAIRRPHEIELRFDLPGVDAGSLEVTVDQGVLSVTAQRSQEFGEDERPFIRQRFMGSFAHRIRLSDSVNADAIEAAYEGGVLTVRVPLREKAQPRKVEVRAAGPVEAPSTEAHGTEAEVAGSEVAGSEAAVAGSEAAGTLSEGTLSEGTLSEGTEATAEVAA